MLEHGYNCLYAARPEAAIDAFRRACAVGPDLGEAWGILGETLVEEGRTGPGRAALARAVVLEPADWRWRMALAGVVLALGDSAAVALYAALVRDREDSAPARRGLAKAYSLVGRAADALCEMREALALDPRDRETALLLADALIRSGDGLAAIELLQAWLSDGDGATHAAAAAAWYVLGEYDRARGEVDRALALAPGEARAAGIAQMLATSTDEALTASYVRALFDRYAERFDRDLVEKLGYVAPALLRGAVDRVRGFTTLGKVRILDLGCGSGLAGVAFKPLALRLDGIDLSPRMVEQARRRKLYDELVVGDIVNCMSEYDSVWDLVVAADVLVYVGALEPIFAAVRRVLVSGGLFAFTVERANENVRSYHLQESRRFIHQVAYVRDLAAASGFTVALAEDCVPRRERGEPVPGALFVLAAP